MYPDNHQLSHSLLSTHFFIFLFVRYSSVFSHNWLCPAMSRVNHIRAMVCFVLTLLLASFTARVTAFSFSLSVATLKQQSHKLFVASTSNDVPSLSEIYPSLSTSLQKLGFSAPTPIQAASAARSKEENLIMIAPTGSGKTLAYLLPAIEKALAVGGTVLVVAPTRELSVQLNYVASSILANLTPDENEYESENEPTPEMKVLLAVKGVDAPTPEQLNAATVLVGTPLEIYQVLTKIQGGLEFIAGDVLSSVILDEVDVLLPPAPKELRTALDGTDKDKRRGYKDEFGASKKKSNNPQDERRRQEQKRKLNAVQRSGVQMSSGNKQVLGPTDNILNLIATRHSSGRDIFPCQVLAGSATASRRTLDRLNKALYDAASEAASTVDAVWAGTVKACRPEAPVDEENSEDSVLNGTHSSDVQHTIRAVTVPGEVKHHYITLSKEAAASPQASMDAVAKAVEILKPKTSLLFLCGEFCKTEVKTKVEVSKNIRVPSERVKKTAQARKRAAINSKKTTVSPPKAPLTFSARQACSVLAKLGIDAMPLHVALGLELNAKDTDEDGDIPPFLVTFEGSARGLHVDDVDAVFLVGRPASAASYLHLAGRVGRSQPVEGGVQIRPGTVVSLCTNGSAKELEKWTKQIGGTAAEELIL
jgi:hypothetical protein